VKNTSVRKKGRVTTEEEKEKEEEKEE